MIKVNILICDEGLSGFMTSLLAGLKNTTGFPSLPITTTFNFGLISFPEGMIFEGDNILPLPWITLHVLSPLPTI
jgi:hypothetical protein